MPIKCDRCEGRFRCYTTTEMPPTTPPAHKHYVVKRYVEALDTEKINTLHTLATEMIYNGLYSSGDDHHYFRSRTAAKRNADEMNRDFSAQGFVYKAMYACPYLYPSCGRRLS